MTPRILSLGRDHSLMPIRTLLLRHSGYTVIEAYSSSAALQCLKSSSFDLVLICHTVFEPERTEFISTVHVLKPELLIACINSNVHYFTDAGCTSVTNVAPLLLTELRTALGNTESLCRDDQDEPAA